jgi:hypothetical protein
MPSRSGAARVVVVTARLPVGPDAGGNLDVCEVGKLVRKREGVGAITLRVALGRVRDDVELLDLVSDRVGHAGRVRLLDEGLGAPRGRAVGRLASIVVLVVGGRVGARRRR